jgi:hypothetical protein
MARSQELAELFQQPTLVAHRRFEACRAYFLERQPAGEIAERFGLSVQSVQSIARDFAANPDMQWFFQIARAGRKTAPKREAVHSRVVELRRQQASLSDIQRTLLAEGQEISEPYLAQILREEGFARLTSRPSVPLPGERACDGSEVPDIADVRELCLESGRIVPTQATGLFLFVPLLLECRIGKAVSRGEYPGTKQIPPLQAVLALLAGKLLGKRRLSHIDDLNTDEGAGLFAGMNVLPKTTYATDYSYRTQRDMNERFLDALVDRMRFEETPLTFHLDFHAVPFRGKDSELENHWVGKQHRGMLSVMAFVAQESTRRVICYATTNVLREEADEMVVKFVDHWKQRHRRYPGRVLFDSRATTYENLNELNKRDVGFITIRRRGSAMVNRVRRLSADSWKRCQVQQAKGKRRKVKYVEETVTLDDYEGELRQIVFDGLGHELPTFILTNDKPERLTAREVIETYASRNHVEHSLGEKITFFHLDCLSSEVRLNVDFDLTLTMAAALLYHQLGERLKGFAESTPHTLYRKFVNTQGRIQIEKKEVVVYFEKRSHNPILKEAGFDQTTAPVPWLNRRKVRLVIP